MIFNIGNNFWYTQILSNFFKNFYFQYLMYANARNLMELIHGLDVEIGRILEFLNGVISNMVSASLKIVNRNQTQYWMETKLDIIHINFVPTVRDDLMLIRIIKYKICKPNSILYEYLKDVFIGVAKWSSFFSVIEALT